MIDDEGRAHLWIVYVLCGLAVLAVAAAILIPGIRWMLRPANLVPAVVALSFLSSLKVFRGWGQLVIWLAILGISENSLHFFG